MSHSRFDLAFATGVRFAPQRGGPIEMSTVRLGELRVPSGRIGAGDPFTVQYVAPALLVQPVPTGSFPVDVALARLGDGDVRVACARVLFAAAPARAVKWEPAWFEGQQPAAPNELPGYGVDGGTGCFYDGRVAGRVDDRVTNAWADALDRNAVESWTWHRADVNAANVAMFSSGWGDGFYASYWGVDDRGSLVELVTDFDVLMEPWEECVEFPLPLPPGRVNHPFLTQHQVTLEASSSVAGPTVDIIGHDTARLTLSDGSRLSMGACPVRGGRRYRWGQTAPTARLLVWIVTGTKPIQPAP